LSHRPEPSDHAVHEEVDGLDIGGQHGRRLFSVPHSQAAEEGISHLYKQEWKRPTQHFVFDKVLPKYVNVYLYHVRSVSLKIKVEEYLIESGIEDQLVGQ